MKPLVLRVRGLHSFREEQVLRFAEVIGQGVFGVFGPTGSGKSSLLDAITLALYGRVERAPRGTQGILNQDESRLEVDFTFELTGSAGPRRYRVQRAYARHEGDGVRGAHCRLEELFSDGSPRGVLADAEREVTAQVVHLLGLTAEDFTRAVVLPQGRFAEFLRLGGKDRRDMLQRLFDLERYGDRLGEHLRARLDQCLRGLEGVERETLGLGEASEQALASARAAFAAAGARAVQAADAATALRREVAAWRDVWEAQAERDAVRGVLAALAAEAPAVAAAEAEWQAAQRAAAARPHLEAAGAARREAADAVTRRERARAAHDAAAEERVAAAAALERHAAARAAEEPALRARREALAVALKLEQDLAALAGRLRLAAQEADRAEVRAQAAATVLAAAEREVAAARDGQDRAHARLQQVQVPPDHRRRVQDAQAALIAWQRASALQQKAADTLAQRRDALARVEGAARAAAAQRGAAEQAYATAREAFDALRAGAPEDDLALAADLAALERGRAALEALLRAQASAERVRELLTAAGARAEVREAEWTRARQARADSDAALEAARAEVDALRRADMAGALAAALAAGKPCPVCGSLEHPAPALPDGSIPGSRLGEAERTLAAAIRQRETTAQAESIAAGEAGAATAAVAEVGRRWDEACAEVRLLRGRLPAEGCEDPAAHLAAAAATLAARQQRQAAWREALRAAEAEGESTLALLRQAEEVAAAALAAQEGARARLQETGAAHDRSLEERDAAAAALAEARGGFTDAEIVAEAAALAQRDDEVRALSEQVAALAEQAATREDRLGAARAAHATARGEADARRQAHGEVAGQEQGLRAELRALTAGAPAAELVADIDGRLQRLRAAEEQARAALEAAVGSLAAASGERGTADDRAAAASERRARAEERLAAALAEAGLDGEERAAAALRSEDALAALRARVEAHRAAVAQAQADEARLLARLAGRRLQAEEWEAWQWRLAAAESDAAAAQQAAGVAQRAAEDLERRHTRWVELEGQRVVLQRERDVLVDLQGVLRGGAFIDFLAEEQLRQVALDASQRLGQLTRYRYALEVDADGGFRIRDDHHGGVRRPVSSLSGGETFLTSLALALALSGHIQLRGRHPLEFFFLDEGFGSLDEEALDMALGALERLQAAHLHIGLISHLAAVRARVTRRVIVEPAEPGGRGSRLRVEVA